MPSLEEDEIQIALAQAVERLTFKGHTASTTTLSALHDELSRPDVYVNRYSSVERFAGALGVLCGQG